MPNTESDDLIGGQLEMSEDHSLGLRQHFGPTETFNKRRAIGCRGLGTHRFGRG